MKVVSIITNHPIFIELQKKSLEKFLKVDYEYIVFNDGKDWPDITNFYDPICEGRQAIIEKCEELKVTCINLPNEKHKHVGCASLRHVDSLQFLLDFMMQYKDEYLVLDGDMFLIDSLDIEKYRKHDCACVLQEGTHLRYIWPNFFYVDLNKLKHIELFKLNIDGADTGSASHHWLETFPCSFPKCEEIRHSSHQFTNEYFYFIKHLWSCSWNENEIPENLKKNETLLAFLKNDFRNQSGRFFCEIYDQCLFHYRAGSNWMGQPKETHKRQLQNLFSVLES
jgi:hypothetical protein